MGVFLDTITKGVLVTFKQIYSMYIVAIGYLAFQLAEIGAD